MNSVEPGIRATPDAIQPLPGEAGVPNVARPARQSVSKKGLLAVALLVISLIAASVFSVQRIAAAWKKSDDPSKPSADRPAGAAGETKRLDLSRPAPTSSMATSMTRIPAIVRTEDDAEPIGVRRSGEKAADATPPAKEMPPEDAPAMLVSGGVARPIVSARGDNPLIEGSPLAQTKRNLETYERRLQGLLDSQPQTALNGSRDAAGVGKSVAPPGAAVSPAAALFGGQLQGSATQKVAASTLGDRSLVMPKGTVFTCALKTKVVSAASGFVGCQVQRNVFSDDGRVLLIERGSHLDGEYRVTSLKPGAVRIPVLWTRVRTPNGVTVELDSPGTGPLGESGVDGYVDNRWPERIGAALLLSLIDDSVQLALQHESPSQGGAVVLPSTTASTSKLADKVLESTINIPPLIYQNQGGIVGIYVARDVDFSSVYELKPVPR